jgi:hypothetical protein
MTQPNVAGMPGDAPGTARSYADPAPAAAVNGVPVAGRVQPAGVPAARDAGDPRDAPAEDELGGTLAALADVDLDAAGRRRALGRLAGQLKERGIADLFNPRAAMRWIADAVSDVVPHLPIRDRNTLREHFAGLSDEQIAERLVRNAARATAAIGAAGGGIAAVEWVATPTLLSAPIVLATETVAVVGVEIKLIGELHELHGVPIEGSATQRTVGLLHSWAQRRGVNPLMPGVGIATILGTGLRKDLRDRLLKRFGRNLTSYGPMLTGAAVASFLNRRATLALADHIRKDLQRSRPVIDSKAW